MCLESVTRINNKNTKLYKEVRYGWKVVERNKSKQQLQGIYMGMVYPVNTWISDPRLNRSIAFEFPTGDFDNGHRRLSVKSYQTGFHVYASEQQAKKVEIGRYQTASGFFPYSTIRRVAVRGVHTEGQGSDGSYQFVAHEIKFLRLGRMTTKDNGL